MSSKTIHLKGLNGLRAIAALAVVISHTTLGLGGLGLNPKIFGQGSDGSAKGLDMAGFGVSIFFALSGFLITYLLMLEKEKNEIDIRKFYLRRILRIWPLYYLYLAVCLIAAVFYGMPFKGTSLLCYCFYGANIPFIIGGMLPFLGHYWSLGVEEQFYAFWPWIPKKLNRRLPLVIGSTVLFLIALKTAFRFLIPNGDQHVPYMIIHVTRFHCMMIGSLGAIFFYNKNERFLQLFGSKEIQLLAWGIMLLILLNRFHIASFLDNEIVSVVAVALIIGQITVKNRLLDLEGDVFDFLGKISYGIYVIHPIIIFGVSKAFGHFNNDGILNYLLVYGSVLSLTIGLAYLSYEYYEKWFLKLKHKYSVIPSSSTKRFDGLTGKESKEVYILEEAKSA